MIRKYRKSITRTELHWTPEGKGKRDRQKNTRRHTVEGEMKTMNNTWGTVVMMAKERQKWRTIVAAVQTNGIASSK